MTTHRRKSHPGRFVLVSSGAGFAAVACLSTVALGQGGDNPSSAVPLALNVTTTGTTVGYSDDSDEVCPYTGSTAPDVYYTYTPSVSHSLTVDLCDSGYDTKIYVYDSSLQLLTDSFLGDPACNDDACSDASGNPFRSQLNCIPLEAGSLYYIVVDGFIGEAGDYTITTSVSEITLGDPDACVPLVCEIDCAPGDVLEGESCDDTFAEEDCYNGGCNCANQDLDNPTAFVDISCGVTICGDANFNGTIRDTDWYLLTDDDGLITTYTWDVAAEFEAVVGRIDNGGVNECSGIIPWHVFDIGEYPCDPLQTVSLSLPDGEYWFFVAPNFTDIITCIDDSDATPLDYRATLTCESKLPPCPWDFDGNTQVDFFDLLEVLAYWGPCP